LKRRRRCLRVVKIIVAAMSQTMQGEDGTAADSVVNRIFVFLDQNPSDFAITILSGGNDDKGIAENLSVSSLLESVVLVDGKHLGLDARKLPWVTRLLRQAYKAQKSRILQHQLKKTNSEEEWRVNWKNLYTTTSCLLLVNPDHSTVWADRRRSVLGMMMLPSTYDVNPLCENSTQQIIKIWSSELDFLDLLVTQHSKAPSSWAHRKYVLRQITIEIVGKQGNSLSDPLPPERLKQLVLVAQREIETCAKVADNFPRNYYAWTHRRYLWEILLPILDCCDINRTAITQPLPTLTNMSIVAPFSSCKLLESELTQLLRKWLPQHTSDHSAVHYASQVLELFFTRLAKSGKTATEGKVSVLQDVQNLVQKYDEHESMWILRRNVLQIFWRTFLVENDNTMLVLAWNNLVEPVYQEQVQQQGAASTNKNHNSHALAFLAWCIVTLEGYYSGAELKEMCKLRFAEVDAIYSALKHHPQITHQMWQLVGKQILNLK
jgi:hypothetical protein